MMSATMWQWVRAGAVIAALPYLFLHMEWAEDRLVSSASGALPADVVLQDVIATKATAPAAPSEIAGAPPIVVPTAVSDCLATSPEPAATVGKSVAKANGKSVAKAKRRAGAPTRATSTKMPNFLQVAAVGRGNKEVRH